MEYFGMKLLYFKYFLVFLFSLVCSIFRPSSATLLCMVPPYGTAFPPQFSAIRCGCFAFSFSISVIVSLLSLALWLGLAPVDPPTCRRLLGVAPCTHLRHMLSIGRSDNLCLIIRLQLLPSRAGCRWSRFPFPVPRSPFSFPSSLRLFFILRCNFPCLFCLSRILQLRVRNWPPEYAFSGTVDEVFDREMWLLG